LIALYTGVPQNDTVIDVPVDDALAPIVELPPVLVEPPVVVVVMPTESLTMPASEPESVALPVGAVVVGVLVGSVDDEVTLVEVWPAVVLAESLLSPPHAVSARATMRGAWTGRAGDIGPR